VDEAAQLSSEVTMTHQIAFSNYVELALLVCCSGMSVYAYLRKPQRFRLFFSIGFGLLVIEFVYGLLLASLSNMPYQVLIDVSDCIGPAALLFLALGMHQLIPKAGGQQKIEAQ
jgi:hypothetical protein